MMDQTFRCDLCEKEIPFAERCRDETIFESGWVICARCEPGLRQRLALSVAKTLSQAGQQVNDHLAPYGPAPEHPALTWNIAAKPQHIAPSLQKQGKQCLDQNERIWTFPHIAESGYQPPKKYRGCIDAYTASYMRWQNKLHVLAWLGSFSHQHALRPVFLDTETTGTRRFSEIIEICIVDEYGQTLFRSLVNPTTEIEPMASAVHGLTRRDVKDAPRYPEVHHEIMNYLYNHTVIAYNASFDIRLLKQTADCYELAFPALHTGCLMYAYAKYREEYVEQSNRQRRCKIHRLEEVMAYERLDMPPLHRAERDAQCVHRLFQAMKARSQLSTLP
jgi:DNA polymerase III epsilon subunit-like protein